MNPNDSLTTRPSALRRLRAGLIGGLCSLFLALLAGQAWATPCDLDQDGDVDLDDVTQLQRLLPSRPTVNGPDDPRDPDRNGRIDIGDVRACVLRCTQPRCARISPTPPTVSLTAPVADARYLAPATITLAANASGAAPLTRVEFLADGTVIATVGNSPYTVDWPNVAAGTYQLSARATDRAGAATTSAARRITVHSSNTPPAVSLTAPADGAAYPLSASVTLAATASDVELNTPISRVDFYHGPTLIGGSTTAPYQLAWTPPAAGVYRLTARATDSAGATTISAAHDLTVQGNLPPTVSLTSPGANQSFTAPATVTLTADANDPDGVARVDFFHGATLIGSAVSSPYRVVWNHVPASRYLLTAQATDRLGASQTSAAVPITVNAPASAGLTILYLHADHLGTPRVATDESQTVVWRNPPTTEPFGMALPEEDPDGDGRVTTINLRFPGQYFDQETQAHYNYFRDHYFPELGRYGQSDPIGLAGGINTYGYVGGNPVGTIDVRGLDNPGQGSYGQCWAGVCGWAGTRVGRPGYGFFSPNPEARGRIRPLMGGIPSEKCNKFVWDSAERGGYPAGRMPDGRIPSASEWGDPHSNIPGYSPMPPGTPPAPGDIVGDGGHVGIYSPLPTGDSGTTSAAAPFQGGTGLYGGVVNNDWGFRPGQNVVIWRAKGR
jgi:RHS repeat-associated protein